MSGGIDFESESRLADSLLKRCIEQVNSQSEVEKALKSPGAIVAIAKLCSVGVSNPETCCLNIFRLGAVVALSIRDVESIK
jgi:hypothetical protein